ncbi:bifunctional folylpolyglutamate synthase/dihydrofolate synthase [Leuconostoc palmae]|uniref:bifunctional folylpolyglutamate synthase/dihydrofolate synthase n=1 Tax=Leuconostoc palmae TaxID=501487 RepID=UPI001C7D6ED1|nr:Mur ligase family protein [Leuconostoc palmae]
MISVEEAINMIHARPKGGKKESLYRMFTLLDALDHPQEKLPPTIHITGTNGKGSVATMTSNILRNAGYKTGLFISPYIVNFRERIQINNDMISQNDLIHATVEVFDKLSVVDDALKPDIPTEFEVLTAIMMTYFATKSLDALVIEVGIGGQLDSTNVMKNSKVAVITSVGLDHQEILGRSIEEIAEQKAGIIHEGMSVVVGNIPAEAKKVIEKRSIHPLIEGKSGIYDPGLPGSYQIENTATAVAAVTAFNASISPEIIKKGLLESNFNARFELIKPNVMIDGAHNEQGLLKLVESLSEYRPFEGKTKTLIIGSLMDKNVVKAFEEIMSKKDFQMILVPFMGPNGRPSLDIEKVAQKYKIRSYKSWQEAYQKVKDNPVVFTGSLYFVSEVRDKL